MNEYQSKADQEKEFLSPTKAAMAEKAKNK